MLAVNVCVSERNGRNGRTCWGAVTGGVRMGSGGHSTSREEEERGRGGGITCSGVCRTSAMAPPPPRSTVLYPSHASSSDSSFVRSVVRKEERASLRWGRGKEKRYLSMGVRRRQEEDVVVCISYPYLRSPLLLFFFSLMQTLSRSSKSMGGREKEEAEKDFPLLCSLRRGQRWWSPTDGGTAKGGREQKGRGDQSGAG